MKKTLLLLLLVPLFLSKPMDAKFAKMSDDAAKSRAIAMWGPQGAVAKFWVAGAQNTWAYQVGCFDPANGFHVTGQGLTSWEAAYANVDPAKNGTFSLFATATQTDGQKTVTPKINIYACDAIFDKNMARYAVAAK